MGKNRIFTVNANIFTLVYKRPKQTAVCTLNVMLELCSPPHKRRSVCQRKTILSSNSSPPQISGEVRGKDKQIWEDLFITIKLTGSVRLCLDGDWLA